MSEQRVADRRSGFVPAGGEGDMLADGERVRPQPPSNIATLRVVVDAHAVQIRGERARYPAALRRAEWTAGAEAFDDGVRVRRACKYVVRGGRRYRGARD